jgi:Carboxylesterase family
MYSFLLSFLLTSTALASSLSSTAPTVAILAGVIEGAQCSSGAVSYLNIPYARSPIGDLRFASPQTYNESYPSGILPAQHAFSLGIHPLQNQAPQLKTVCISMFGLPQMPKSLQGSLSRFGSMVEENKMAVSRMPYTMDATWLQIALFLSQSTTGLAH